MTRWAAALVHTLLYSALIACSAPSERMTLAPPGPTIASPSVRTASTEAARRRQAEAGRAPLLLSPFGRTAAPAPEALPLDETVRTRGGQYATRQEAEELDRQLGGAVVWVDVDCCISAAIDRAQGQVAGLMSVLNLAADAPVFVTGAEQALAARAADGLSDHGLTRVLLVAR